MKKFRIKKSVLIDDDQVWYWEIVEVLIDTEPDLPAMLASVMNRNPLGSYLNPYNSAEHLIDDIKEK